MSEPLPVIFTALAAQHIRKAEVWWRENRTLAPNAVRQELERALVLIAGQPRIGSRAMNVKTASRCSLNQARWADAKRRIMYR